MVTRDDLFPPAGVDAPLPHLRIEPSRSLFSLGIGELWEFRELLYFLIWRDLKVRYKQTVLGVLWAVIQPTMTMLVFSVIFGKLGKLPSDGIPYPIFSFAALVPWTLFSNGMSQATVSLVGSANLIKKVYFPRIIIPVATVLTGVVDFLLSFLVLLVLMVYFGVVPGLKILALPLLLVLTTAASLSASIWLSALNVRYRDVRYVVPFLTQIWMFLTPIAYSSSMLSEPWRTVYYLNPMVPVVEGFRWALAGAAAPPLGPTIMSALLMLLVMGSGVLYFRRTEKSFADII